MRVLFIILVLLCVPSAAAAENDVAALWAALRAGSHVALIRHAGTAGSGEPPGFRPDDCATQRNLTDQGRAEARRLGERFRAERVPIGKVLSSQWCRCQETAASMGLPTPEVALPFNAFTAREAELAARGRDIVAAWSGPGTLVVVTHGGNIQLLTDIHPEEGGVVVVKADPAVPQKLRVLGRIPLPP